MQTWRNFRDVIICAVATQNGQKCHRPYDSGNALCCVALERGGGTREVMKRMKSVEDAKAELAPLQEAQLLQ